MYVTIYEVVAVYAQLTMYACICSSAIAVPQGYIPSQV